MEKIMNQFAESVEILPFLLTLLGTGLVILEALVPGAYMIVFGVSILGAGIVGLLVPWLGDPMSLGLLSLAFAVVSFLSYRKLGELSGASEKTKASDNLMGEVGEVTKTVGKHEGEVKLTVGFDPHYSARSHDGSEIAEGTDVVVVDPGGGNVVHVMPVANLDTVGSPSEIKSQKDQVIEELQRKHI